MRKQSGFTLIEIAIVLVIIGLLLGGILKGQELINSAKVKNLATDFRSIPVYIYGYQDKFKALPGDDSNVTNHVGSSGTPATIGTKGNGMIEGTWNTAVDGAESCVFWQHVRLAGLAPGPTTVSCAANNTYQPRNAEGGLIGIQSGGTTPPITGLRGTYIICSAGILGKFATQLDIMLDDGKSDAGSVMATAAGATVDFTSSQTAVVSTSPLVESTTYTVCMGV